MDRLILDTGVLVATVRGRATVPDDADIAIDDQPDALLQLDEAMNRLTALQPRLARVVECRVFGGMSEEEIGVALGISWRTVHRDWVKARGWLALKLSPQAI